MNVASWLKKKECKRILEWVATIIQWELCNRFEFNYVDKKYQHKSETTLANKNYKIFFLGFRRRPTNPHTQTRIPVAIIWNKEKRTWRIGDVVVSKKDRVGMKKSGGLKNYKDHAPESRELWNLKVRAMSIIVGAIEQQQQQPENQKKKTKIQNNIEIEIR